MSYEFTGRLVEIFPMQEVTATFKKREFIVEKSESVNDRTFTNFIKFQMTQDKGSALDNYKVGDEVKVTFNLRGSKWEKEGRSGYITNLEAWRIEKMAESSAPKMNSTESAEPSTIQEEDDLPF